MTTVQRLQVVATNPPAQSNQASSLVALFAPDGSALVAVKKQAAQVDSVAADLTAMKADFNALLAKLRAAGVLAP